MAESAEQSPVKNVAKSTKIDPLRNFPEKQAIPPKKILFLGDPDIGKTTFIEKYCENVATFYRCYGYNGPQLVLTQFLLFHEQDEKNILIRLMDFPPTTIEESRKEQYLDEVDCIVLCFAVDNSTSFANVWKIWLPEAKKYYPDFNRFYLLGLRNDTRREMLEGNKMPVTLERGNQIHEKYKFCGEYMECSVEENPQQAFDMMKTIICDAIRSELPPEAV